MTGPAHPDAPPRMLTIAGSDSGGGAGIQADIKTACAFGVYAASAITSITVQNTNGVCGVHPVPPAIIAAQIEAVLTDIGADAIKIGMLGTAEAVIAVAAALERLAGDTPIILDPVMVATSGDALGDSGTLALMLERLVPLALLATPNLMEARALCGEAPANADDAERLAAPLFARGLDAVLFKGGHGDAPAVTDFLVQAAPPTTHTFVARRIDTRHTHGTGCTLSSAIACGIAAGLDLADATARAHAYVQAAIRTAPGLGGGHGPLNHMTGPLAAPARP